MVLIHHPSTAGLKHSDPRNAENRAGTWRALEEYVDAGLVKSIGVSNYHSRHIEELWKIARIKPVINQFELHPLYVEHDTIATCKTHGILVQAYCPFARFDKRLVENKIVTRIAKNHNIDVARTILVYLLNKGFIVLPKSEHEERIANNIRLAGIELSSEEVDALDELGKSQSVKVCWTSDDVI